MNKEFIFFLSLLFFSPVVKAQEEERGMVLIASHKKDSILLRWTPNHPLVWKKANRNGYSLERFVLYRDGKKLDVPERKILLQGIKPRQVMWWEEALQDTLTDDYNWICVGAQAIYGEEFDAIDQKLNPIMETVQKTCEHKNCFSFALLAADQSLRTARAMGLSYTDKEIKANEVYEYCVYPTQLSIKVDTGYVYTGISDHHPLPKPSGLKVQVDSCCTVLSWNQVQLTATYKSYGIERSDDGGKTYQLFTQYPLNLIDKKNGQISIETTKTNCLPDIGQEYFYRIYGITVFGEKGPCSKPLLVKCKLTN